MEQDVYDKIQKLNRSTRTRVFMMIARGAINVVKDVAGALRKVQGSFFADETLSNIDQYQEYGFTSHPPPGGECISVFIAGNRGGGLIIATEDRRYRIELEEGEVAIYSKFGASVKLDKDDKITVDGTDVDVTASGSVVVDGAAVAGIKLGAAATLPVARHNDEVRDAPAGGGNLIGYVNAGVAAVPRVKVFTE